MKCECLPSCTEQFFRVKTTLMRQQSRYPELRPAYNRNATTTTTPQFARLHVYYEDIACVKYRREIYMTWDALIAAVGGVFALCLGGSVISLFEWLYEFTFGLGERLMMSEPKKKQRPADAAMRFGGYIE